MVELHNFSGDMGFSYEGYVINDLIERDKKIKNYKKLLLNNNLNNLEKFEHIGYRDGRRKSSYLYKEGERLIANPDRDNRNSRVLKQRVKSNNFIDTILNSTSGSFHIKVEELPEYRIAFLINDYLIKRSEDYSYTVSAKTKDDILKCFSFNRRNDILDDYTVGREWGKYSTGRLSRNVSGRIHEEVSFYNNERDSSHIISSLQQEFHDCVNNLFNTMKNLRTESGAKNSKNIRKILEKLADSVLKMARVREQGYNISFDSYYFDVYTTVCSLVGDGEAWVKRIELFIKRWSEEFIDKDIYYEIRTDLDSFHFLGNGCEVENRSSCWRYKGEYETNPENLFMSTPSFVINLFEKNGEDLTHYGRCIGIAQNDFIFLNNFYYQKNTTNDRELFVKVIKECVDYRDINHADKFIYDGAWRILKDDIHEFAYMNNEPPTYVILDREDSYVPSLAFLPSKSIKLKAYLDCPVCSQKVSIKSIIYCDHTRTQHDYKFYLNEEQINNALFLNKLACDGCIRSASPQRNDRCDHCDEIFDEELTEFEGNVYCGYCLDEILRYCGDCGIEGHRDNMCWDDETCDDYCYSCYRYLENERSDNEE